jgi:hypothetical protein
MAATTYQIGETVYIPYGSYTKSPKSAKIAGTESIYAGGQANFYSFENELPGFRLPESLVFETKELLEAYSDALIDSI